jgi:hypothetical protein
MGRITPFIAALVVALVPACKREHKAPASSPKTTEPSPAAAQDEAESALETAREAKATAESALETAREAQATAAARARTEPTPGTWWNRALLETETAPAEIAAEDLTPADRISISGRVTESSPDRVLVAPAVGTPLAARVGTGTSVTIDGQSASSAELAPGTEVRMLYHLDGAQVIAERLDVHH